MFRQVLPSSEGCHQLAIRLQIRMNGKQVLELPVLLICGIDEEVSTKSWRLRLAHCPGRLASFPVDWK